MKIDLIQINHPYIPKVSVFLPKRYGFDIGFIDFESVLVDFTGFNEFLEVFLVYFDTGVPQFFELVVLHSEGIGSLLDAGVIDVGAGGLGVEAEEDVLEVVEFVGGCELVEYLHLLKVLLSALLYCQAEAFD
jgi:hypothetical protein